MVQILLFIRRMRHQRMSGGAAGLGQDHMVVLLRWVLIIATSYLVLFSRDLNATPPSVALFIAFYLASNLLLSAHLPRIRGQRWFDVGVVLFDIVAIGIGLSLTENGAVDFFPIFFLVILIGALTERISLVVGAAALIGIVHLSSLSHYVASSELFDTSYILRIPFLFVVALFFGFEAKIVRSRERSERNRERTRQATESLSAVTHDLKNPLGVIQSLADLLLDGDAGALTPDQASLVRRIHANVRRVMHLSTNLLDVTRIQAGRLELRRAPTNLREVVEAALSLARSGAEIKGIALQFSTQPTVAMADIDGLQIERVASNLLDNAIKYTPTGGVITVSVRSEGNTAVLEVADTGPGIALEELSLLFDKYQRAPESSRIHGTGLGLFIVKAIVEAHGGTIDIASEVGKGTTVRVGLSTERPINAPHASALEAEPAWPQLALTANAD